MTIIGTEFAMTNRDEVDIPSEKSYLLLAFGIIFLYCLIHASARFLISPVMQLDEAEQFLDGSVFRLGYSTQPPLYTWIVGAVSSISGLNLATLLGVKYALTFFFYFTFFLTARTFWNSQQALLITGSLVLFPLYSYEFNRDLSHSILVSLMAVSTCFFYSQILRKGDTFYYILMGLSAGLGILSKYNFIIFLLAMMLASLSCKQGRRILFNRRIFLAIVSGILVVLPHMLWLVNNNFPSISFAIGEARLNASVSPPLLKLLTIAGKAYIEAAIFIFIFMLFFCRNVLQGGYRKNVISVPFCWLSFYGLFLPLIIICFLQVGSFKGRWLAPVFFTLPFTMFSRVNLDMKDIRLKIFGVLCATIVVVVLCIRICAGLMPDQTNKIERIHIPFRDLSLDIRGVLKENGMNDTEGIIIVTDDKHLAANIMAWIPGTRFTSLQSAEADRSLQNSILSQDGILVWNASKLGENIPERYLRLFPSVTSFRLLKAQYIHSKKFKPFVLGIAVIHGKTVLSQ